MLYIEDNVKRDLLNMKHNQQIPFIYEQKQFQLSVVSAYELYLLIPTRLLMAVLKRYHSIRD